MCGSKSRFRKKFPEAKAQVTAIFLGLPRLQAGSPSLLPVLTAIGYLQCVAEAIIHVVKKHKRRPADSLLATVPGQILGTFCEAMDPQHGSVLRSVSPGAN